jgi:hypothetical protein
LTESTKRRKLSRTFQVNLFFKSTMCLDNSYAMREELELLKEESLFLSEELAKYQRHSSFLEDEVNIFP